MTFDPSGLVWLIVYPERFGAAATVAVGLSVTARGSVVATGAGAGVD